ncbi:MAG: Arm DNA-binding domain-containing protein [bacterium]
MTRATCTLLFFIKRTKVLKDGTMPIYERITVNRQRIEFGLHFIRYFSSNKELDMEGVVEYVNEKLR